MNDRHISKSSDQSSLEPTLIGISAKPSVEHSPLYSHTSSSRANVAVVDASQPHWAEATAELLRQRLGAAALVLLVGVGLLFIRELFVSVPFRLPRAMLLLVLIASYVFLKSKISLSLKQLRTIELTLFSLVGVQLVWMQTLLIMHAADAGNPLQLVVPMQMGILSWFALIMLYGMFIPNTWRRAALMIVPPTLAPLAVIGVLCFRDPTIAAAANAAQIKEAAIVFLIGSAASIYGTHTIYSLRSEAFKAKQFGQYHLKQLIGKGGMGEVYLAEHQLLKRPCAIKLIRPGQGADPVAIARFEHEVRATAKLSHWNTVNIYDYGRTDDGTFYYVMEYLEGLSLSDLVSQHGPMPPERAIHFLRQICHALTEAHNSGLIHRDIKPANIFAAKQGGAYDIAKLLDFGLAKRVGNSDDQELHLTQEGGFSGSPLYMSPEQATAESIPDGRSDIYALGAVAYFLVTGRPPFEGTNPIRVMIAHARDEVIPPSQLTTIPQDLEAIILRCLAKRPSDRFAAVEDLDRALAKCGCAGQWTEERAAEWWHVNPTRE
jgi:tRNA A-37 threonylcarbamoyl transferase component Bud32